MSDKFRHRSFQPELMDGPDIPKNLLIKNLQELDFINRVSGGHSISLNAIKKLVTVKDKIYHIADLGCGSGAAMKVMASWARLNGFKVKLTGIDKNIDAINYLNEYCKEYSEISGFAGDYRNYFQTETPIDIIHCSLFCHHLKDAELDELLSYIKRFVKTGFVINDLVRNRIAYYGVRMITNLLNGSKLSKNDGPISVLRAFRRKELDILIQKAQIKNYSIKWKWAFRYLVIGNNYD
jgi:SAM-dependent methyltransferase